MCIHLGSFGCHFSSFRELALTEEHVELADKELLSSGQVVAGGNAKGKVRVTEGVGHIGYEVGVIHTHRENLGGGERNGEGEGWREDYIHVR